LFFSPLLSLRAFRRLAAVLLLFAVSRLMRLALPSLLSWARSSSGAFIHLLFLRLVICSVRLPRSSLPPGAAATARSLFRLAGCSFPLSTSCSCLHRSAALALFLLVLPFLPVAPNLLSFTSRSFSSASLLLPLRCAPPLVLSSSVTSFGRLSLPYSLHAYSGCLLLASLFLALFPVKARVSPTPLLHWLFPFLFLCSPFPFISRLVRLSAFRPGPVLLFLSWFLLFVWPYRVPHVFSPCSLPRRSSLVVLSLPFLLFRFRCLWFLLCSVLSPFLITPRRLVGPILLRPFSFTFVSSRPPLLCCPALPLLCSRCFAVVCELLVRPVSHLNCSTPMR